MSSHHDTLSTRPEHEPTTQELVQYIDTETPDMGEFAVLFETPGDVIELGEDADFKYARHLGPDGIDYAIIITKSGNVYGMGAGVVINNEKRKASKLPDKLSAIPIGSPWAIERVGTTTEVDKVIFRRGGLRGGLGSDGARVIDQPSPFRDLIKELESARDQLYPGEPFPSRSWD
jgi:hypothetical protein